MATRVEIVAYDPGWPQRYRESEGELRRILGALAIAVDHIGSTAVPGMAAKAIIDIDVTLKSLADVAAASALLVEAGYQARGNRYDDDVWAFLLQDVEPKLRVYLCPPDNETHRRRLVFRDHLRSREDSASAYAALKARLADAHRYDGDRYTVEKSSFINAIVDREPRLPQDQP
ncbi:GrpB family protein [Ensifer adhaerens]|uniref:GrpB family protein n=1 Tax=Ensifer adhaerens TaxID=106592 RepID=UPI003D040B15